MKLLKHQKLVFQTDTEQERFLGDMTKGIIRTIFFKGLCTYEKKSRSVKDEHVWTNSEVTKKYDG